MAEIIWIFIAIALALLIGAVALTEADIPDDDYPDAPDEHATDPGESEPYTLATGVHTIGGLETPKLTTIADDEQHG